MGPGCQAVTASVRAVISRTVAASDDDDDAPAWSSGGLEAEEGARQRTASEGQEAEKWTLPARVIALRQRSAGKATEVVVWSRTALILAESPLQEARREMECWRAASIFCLSSGAKDVDEEGLCMAGEQWTRMPKWGEH
eukprot:1916763-Rhodomonas_salina.3